MRPSDRRVDFHEMLELEDTIQMLHLSEVCKSFGTRRVLDALSFNVQPGEIYGLLGPNGAGKSTTFNIVCNMVVADGGQVAIGGRSPAEVPRRMLGVVSQQIALYQNLTVAENLSFFGAIYGLRSAELAERVNACLDDIQLSDRRASVVRDLSGGMQRRVHVAASLVYAPRLVILDEPSVGLDIESRQQLWSLLKRLQAKGTAILLATHLLDEADTLCTRIGILRQGRLIAEGTPEALRSRIPATEIAIVQSPDINRVIELATQYDLATRSLDHGLAVWLNRKMELREVLDLFEGVPIESISRRPVTLEDAYVELARNAGE